MKKTVIFLMAMLLVLSSLTPLQTSAADDLTGHTYEKEIRELMQLGIITGYDDGTVKPEREVTRAEFARMVVKSFELETQLEAAEFTSAAAETIDFKDVQAGAWFTPSIMDAVKAGITVGYPDNTFRPNELISREQMASMVSRALTAKGVLTDTETIPALSFGDSESISDYSKKDVRILTHLGIMRGNTDNTFAPKQESKRWMVALVMIKAREVVFPPKPLEFQASSIDADSTTVLKHFDTFAEAKAYVQNNADADVVERSKQIVWMQNGLAVTNAYTEVYPTADLKWGTGTRASQFKPYTTTNTEMKFLDSTAASIKVELAGKVGYVKPSVVRLIPTQMLGGQSYYEKNQYGSLVHKIYNHSTGNYASSGAIGKAPAAFQTGVRYYSFDGAVFTDKAGKVVTEAHQYFSKLPLSTKTSYTAEELDKFLTDNFPYYGKTVAGKLWNVSPLAGSGAYFKQIEETYKVNALYLLAHAIHESGWGTSKIAQDKNNLFGYGAVDGNAYDAAYSYATFKESIQDAAVRINKNYHQVGGAYYNGSILGNKALGMNVRYASDPLWGEKIGGHMYRIDVYLGKRDMYNENLGFASFNDSESGLNFRSGAGVENTALYALPEAGIPVVITGEAKDSKGVIWYKVLPEQKQYTDAYVHSAYIKPLPLAE
ncbi:S-layer homology domain-containing protein [Planococcus halotolerans]|uniref:S-layer protein n=1 Tax=Planococcus halotolerans TaxID=2233542 RepID=A0A365L5U4_9BACL|nr:S-layer homology domain-containing protein [Planococcus halotolerans]RAZ80745.1 S-layer protein [Planococcus halotolerans]